MRCSSAVTRLQKCVLKFSAVLDVTLHVSECCINAFINNTLCMESKALIIFLKKYLRCQIGEVLTYIIQGEGCNIINNPIRWGSLLIRNVTRHIALFTLERFVVDFFFPTEGDVLNLGLLRANPKRHFKRLSNDYAEKNTLYLIYQYSQLKHLFFYFHTITRNS